MENATRIVRSKIHRAKPCLRCGTHGDVTLTWAVPLDQGGQESEWNLHALCAECRAHRETLTEREGRQAESVRRARAGTRQWGWPGA